MIKEMKIIVKCPVSDEDVVFKLKQHSNNYDWYIDIKGTVISAMA